MIKTSNKKNNNFSKIGNLLKSKYIMLALASLMAMAACKSDDQVEPNTPANPTNPSGQVDTLKITTKADALNVLPLGQDKLNNGSKIYVKDEAGIWVMDSRAFMAVLAMLGNDNAVVEKPAYIEPNSANTAMPRVAYEKLNKPMIVKKENNAKYFRISKNVPKNIVSENGTKVASDTLELGANDEISTINSLYKETKNLTSATNKVYQTTLDELNTKFGADSIPNIGAKVSFGVVEGHSKTQEITEAMKANKLRYNNGFYPMAKCLNFDVLTKTDVPPTTITYLSNFEQIMKFKNEQGGNILRGRPEFGVTGLYAGPSALNYYDRTINSTTTSLYLSDLIEIASKFDYDTLQTYSSWKPKNYMQLRAATAASSISYYTIIYDIPDIIPDYPEYDGRTDTLKYILDTYKIWTVSHIVISMAKSKGR